MPQNHRIARIEAYAYRCPVETPVDTSFGRMSDRPAVFVRLEDEDGCFGWGEVFANWPAAGAEHRVNLIERDLAQLVLGQTVEDPADFFGHLSTATRIRALQSGEWGPFRQTIAGIDTALWDMKARAADLSLRKLLNPEAADRLPAYASGIHIGSAPSGLARAREDGFKAFKVKVGFNLEHDAQAVRSMAGTLDKGETLYTDANQAFNATQAMAFLSLLNDAPIGWLEEPIAADAPSAHWKDVAASTHIPLAGGENFAGKTAFADAIQAGHLKFIQPDIAKWGGISGCFAVARAAKTADLTYCPHFLGGGIGLSASTELLAAVGGDGLLEVDVNPNPLRQAFAPSGIDRSTGTWAATSKPGLGCDELPPELARYKTHQIGVHL
ncbi:mandelate racemase/muconate lactonizing enzyme family protein [Hoeflea poritis]|uniref:Mandelate racemase/muconate lactonizing enzyme family protein n=1 Tax=Hoeflea poritis TaxID=2993659 RepID=A0ABT4VQC3_9HYPH|nr:mandelate racemase/muconate lactonizing enzyme family protein [Hoeflea poritis]MDA4846819.1 mandelate racemase/muconate lactonizing enzyme family protein [Hoeflea poritis]